MSRWVTIHSKIPSPRSHQKQSDWLLIISKGLKHNQLSGNHKNKVHYQRWRSHRVNGMFQGSPTLSQKLNFQIKCLNLHWFKMYNISIRIIIPPLRFWIYVHIYGVSCLLMDHNDDISATKESKPGATKWPTLLEPCHGCSTQHAVASWELLIPWIAF